MKSLSGLLVLGLLLAACGKEDSALPNGRAKVRPSDFGGSTASRSVQKIVPCPEKNPEGRGKASTMRDRILQVRCYGQ